MREKETAARHSLSHAVFLGLVLLFSFGSLSARGVELTIEPRGAILRGAPIHLEIGVEDLAAGEEVNVRILADGIQVAEHRLAFGSHEIVLEKLESVGSRVSFRAITEGAHGAEAELEVKTIAGWISVLPPVVAIALALIFKDVLLALFVGIFTGVLFLVQGNPITAFARSIDSFVVPALADGDHAALVVFTLLLGGMVGVINRSGGSQGIVERLTPYATNPMRGQLATWMMGILIFFDDYANTLIVGTTMRPITDRLRISREKLAYIVDSTAAPVASLVPISTWIGFEVGLIAASFTALDLPFNAYGTFVSSIAFRFYPIFALVLGFTIALSQRDFGPMLKAERRAASTGAVIADGDTPLADYTTSTLTPPEGSPRRSRNALIPISTVIALTIVGLWSTGSAGLNRVDFATFGAYVREVFAESDPFATLLWSSAAGLSIAILLAIGQRILSIRQCTEATVEGFKSMLLAMCVLILAWSIQGVCTELHTADFLVELTHGVLSPRFLPALVFALSAAVSFATGTSWGTMGILLPLVIPIAHGLSTAAGYTVDDSFYYTVIVGTISSVLAGSVWGDHCSPISDTTILSSMASGCDHIAHVRTQVPYALSLGILGMLIGDLPTAFGLPPWISILVGSAIIVSFVLWRGQTPEGEKAA